jgi:hypothetical protein
MHFTIINLAGIASPFILAATLWNLWRESRSRSLMLRMTPPERRPRYHAARPFRISARAGKRANPDSQSHPLWTLRDCRMELLTEGTMHAFDASCTSYRPDRVAANRPPRSISSRLSLQRANAPGADNNSILLHTLERTANLFSPEGERIYAEKPSLEHDCANRLSYLPPVR